jgi:Lysophospholipase L1 and related esterases
MMPRTRRLFALVGVAVLLWLAHRLMVSGQEVTNRHGRGTAIVCFGDSLTAGTGADADQSYPAHLGRLLGRHVINAGVPGDTTASALARVPRDVLAHSPRIVCITLGGNDFKNGVSRTEAFANLEAIVREIHAAGAMVVLVGIQLPMFGRGWSEGYCDLAKRTGSVLIPNAYEGVMGHPELMSDPIHPNGRGYEVLARRVHRAIKPHLQ